MRASAVSLLLLLLLCACTQGEEAMARYREKVLAEREAGMPRLDLPVRQYTIEGCTLTLKANGTATLGFVDGSAVRVRDESQIYEIGPIFLYQMEKARPAATGPCLDNVFVDRVWGDMVESWRLNFAVQELVPTVVAEMRRNNEEARMLAAKLVERGSIVVQGESLPMFTPGDGAFPIPESQRGMLKAALDSGVTTGPGK